MDVDEITRQIVEREGGFVDDPDDPGGATKHGVTIGTMQRLGLDIDGDGQITKADVRRLTKGQVETIFKNHYFMKPKIHKIYEPLQPSVYDMYVNSGDNAVRILQRLVRLFDQECDVDGAIGNETIGAVAAAAIAAPDHIVDAYGIARRNYYYRLADKKYKLRKFARTNAGGKGGWIIRAEEFMDSKYHYSEADHLERTKQWD